MTRRRGPQGGNLTSARLSEKARVRANFHGASAGDAAGNQDDLLGVTLDRGGEVSEAGNGCGRATRAARCTIGARH